MMTDILLIPNRPSSLASMERNVRRRGTYGKAYHSNGFEHPWLEHREDVLV